MADVGQVLANAQAANESAYDTGVTAAKNTLAGALSNADVTLADAQDAAAQARDNTSADAQQQRDDALVGAEQQWKDSYEAAAVSEERANVAAYSAYLASVTAAGVTLDDAVSAAGVAQNEADAASGVVWTDTVDAAWEQQQQADATAAVQWDADTAAADNTALDATRQANEACNNTEMAAWQQQVDTVLSAEGDAVHGWAEQSGTGYAHLMDVEMAAGIRGMEDDVAAAVGDAGADFNAEVDKVVAEDEADDVEANAVDANAQVGVKTEADAVVADAHDESQAAADEVTAVDTAWQSDEHAATVDAAAHDNDEATAAVVDANADQDADATWEKAEAQAANTDQQAVDVADNQAAHAQDAAVKTGNDQIAQDQKDQQNQDATAAQTRDTKVAAVHHDTVVQGAQVADAAIRAAASQAAQGVQAEVQLAPNALIAAANAAVADAQAQNADLTAKSIDLADQQRAALVRQVQQPINAANQAAWQKLQTDGQRPLNDPVLNQVNPPPPQSGWQTLIDFIPGWKTVAGVVLIGVGTLLLPAGVGPVLFAVGVGMLAASAAYNSYDRYFNQNQSGLQSLVGGTADASGVGALYTGISGRDLATQRHLGLTDAQQRQLITEGSIQTAGTLLLVYGGVKGARSFFRGRAPAASKPPIEPPAMSGTPKPPPVTPEPLAPPAKTSAGSNAGKAGMAEQATVQDACFVAGTPICQLYGCKPIEQIRPGDRVLSRDQDNPSGPVVEQVVEKTFIRLAPVICLTVGGHELRPTGEHPFYVPGRGWVLAWSLRSGDVIHTLSGEPVTVDRVEETGEVVRVYNFHVRELQTYFVGGDAWGFAIWSHNTNGHQAGDTARLTQRAEEIHSALDPIAAKQRTTAVLETTGGDIVGSGVRDLTPAQRALLSEGEIAARLAGEHAEITVVQEAAQRGFQPIAIGTTRDMCPACQQALKSIGATITSLRTATW